MNNGSEIKVGAFVIIATLIIAIMSIAFGKVKFGEADIYHVGFRIINAEGIAVDTNVLYKGIKVGKVDSVTLEADDIVIKLSVYENYQIPKGISIATRQSGLVGSKFVELVPDPNSNPYDFIEANQTYDGKQAIVSLDAVMAEVGVLSSEVTKLVSSLNEVFSSEDGKASLTNSLKNVEMITKNLDDILEYNEESIGIMVKNIEQLTTAVNHLVANNSDNIDQSLENIAAISEDMKVITESLEYLMANNQGDIDETIKNINSISEKVDTSLADINNITKDINEGKGTLGMLVNDNTTKENIQEVVQSLSAMTDKLNEWKLYVTFGAEYMSAGKYDGRGYGQIRLYTHPYKYYMVGVSNTSRPTSTTKTTQTTTTTGGTTQVANTVEVSSDDSSLALSLQYGHIFQQMYGLRIGIFDNTIGIGGDFYPLKNDNLVISAEAYNFDAPTNGGVEFYTRLFARWNFWSNFFLQAGVEDLLGNDETLFTIGGGVRFADDDLKYFVGPAASAIQ